MNRQLKATVTSFLTVTLAIVVVPVFAQAPDGVSPGSVDRIAEIEGRCPSFSWGVVPGAEHYQLVGYRVPEELRPIEVDLSQAEQVLYTEVPGTAASWTPNLRQCLTPGENYAWFVRAVFREDQGEVVEASEWSYGRFFSISPMPSAREVEEALSVLRRYARDSRSGTAVIDPQVLVTEAPRTQRPGLPPEAQKSVISAKSKGSFSDNSGIGKASPGYILDVRGDTSTYLGYFNNTSTASSAYGIFSQAYAYNNASAVAYAGNFFSVGGNTGGTTYGINSDARAYGTSTAYGVYSVATSGTTTGNEYAFYGLGKGFFSQDLDVNGTVKMGYERIAGVSVALTSSASCSIVNSGTCYYNSTSISCPTGKVAMGGGCNCSSAYNCYIVDSYLSSNSSYYCKAAGSSSAYTVTPYVTCARMGD